MNKVIQADKTNAVEKKILENAIGKYNQQVVSQLRRNKEVSRLLTGYLFEFFPQCCSNKQRMLIYALTENFQRLHDQLAIALNSLDEVQSEFLIDVNRINQLDFVDADCLGLFNEWPQAWP